MSRTPKSGETSWGHWGALAITACAFSITATLCSPADCADPADEKGAAEAPKEGRLWNIADVPFKYRLARTRGSKWSEEITLAPGKAYVIRAPKPGESSDLEGLTGRGNGYVNIRFAELGGFIHYHLSARNQNEELVPNWYHVKDSNGFSRLIQAATIEEAKARQAELLAEEPLTPKEIEATRRLLKANWVFYDK